MVHLPPVLVSWSSRHTPYEVCPSLRFPPVASPTFIGTVGLSDYLRPVCCTPFVDSHTALLHLKTEDTGSPTVDAMSLYSMTGVPMGWTPLL